MMAVVDLRAATQIAVEGLARHLATVGVKIDSAA